MSFSLVSIIATMYAILHELVTLTAIQSIMFQITRNILSSEP